jgi:hypothetical protein
LGMIFSLRRSSTNRRSSKFVVRGGDPGGNAIDSHSA